MGIFLCYTQIKMIVYLDNCALNRPFDDQSQERIRIETEAIVLVLSHLERRDWIWLGSQVLDNEIEKTPDPELRFRLKRITSYISQSVNIGSEELERALELEKAGFIGFDAIHLACAESGKANIFLTTDDRLLKQAKRHKKELRVKVQNPLDWIKEILN
jgi:predicted nucleic acid-binding protein